jgi:hypothetical protein
MVKLHNTENGRREVLRCPKNSEKLKTISDYTYWCHGGRRHQGHPAHHGHHSHQERRRHTDITDILVNTNIKDIVDNTNIKVITGKIIDDITDVPVVMTYTVIADKNRKHGPIRTVPHSGSGVAPMSSLSGVELLGFWEFGMGGLIG